MVNGFLPLELEGKGIPRQFTKSLHYLRGYHRLFGVPKGKHDLLEPVPRNVLSFAKKRTEDLESLLATMLGTKRGFVQEYEPGFLNLTQMMHLYEWWVVGCKLQAHVVFTSVDLLTLAFSSLESSSQQGPRTSKVATSIFSWFFSHLANYYVTLPAFLEESRFPEPPFASELRLLRSRVNSERAVFSPSGSRDTDLGKLAEFRSRFLEYYERELPNSLEYQTCAITMLSQDTFSRRNTSRMRSNLLKHFKRDIGQAEFDSNFVLEPMPRRPLPEDADPSLGTNLMATQVGAYGTKRSFLKPRPKGQDANSMRIAIRPMDLAYVQCRNLQRRFFEVPNANKP